MKSTNVTLLKFRTFSGLYPQIAQHLPFELCKSNVSRTLPVAIGLPIRQVNVKIVARIF